ncbi:MAG: hypothetical protein OEX05_02190 [Chloroflexota bacterium]|jgi:hypothetical protein|nr:hypothetical protein [Chloroflexota bacterium]
MTASEEKRTPRPPRRRFRTRLERWIAVLVVLNAGIVAILLGTVILDQINSPPPGHPAQQGSSPSPTAELMEMGLAHIPTSNACVLCHESGGSAGLKVIPAIGHPLDGWRQCLVCHTNEKLGRSAPGHSGIPETECLNCHKIAPPGPAITQPHSALQDQLCLDCHGSFSHLPSSMASRDEDSCTLCHVPTALPPPEYAHAVNERLGCRDCHQSADVGSLPIDHALRSDSTCLLCHLILQGAGPGASPAGS